MPVCLQFFDERNHFLNVVGCLADNVGVADVQRVNIFHKGIGIELGHFQHGLMAFFGSLYHFVVTVVAIASQVSYIGDVHNVFDVVTQIRKRLVQNVQKDIGAQVSDVGIVVYRRSASVKAHVTRRNRLEFLHGMSHRVEQS